MKKGTIFLIAFALCLGAAAVVFIPRFTGKVGKVSENLNIPMFIDTLMNNEKQKLAIASDNNSESVRLANFGFNRDGQVLDSRSAKALLTLHLVYEKIYPNQQFINYRCLANLLKKYDLSLGLPDRFMGNVPKYAIDSLENFQASFIYTRTGETERSFSTTELAVINKGYGPIGHYLEGIYDWITKGRGPLPNPDSNLVTYSLLDMKMRKRGPSPFFIVAPSSYFSGEANEKGVFGEVKVKDPLVLSPVVGGYIIVCSW